MTLEAQNLKIYAFRAPLTLKAVDGVSFRVAEAQQLTLLGERSTTLVFLGRCVARLEPADARFVGGRLLLHDVPGMVKRDEVDILRLGRADRLLRQIRRHWLGYLTGEDGLSPIHRVGAQLRECLRWRSAGRRGSPVSQVRHVLAELGLADPDHILRAYPHQLPPQERCVANLAGGLIGDPQVIVADDPVRGTDARLRQRLLTSLRRRREAGAAILLITADLDAARCGTHLAVLHAGHVVEEGNPAELLQDPQHPFTQALVRAADHGTLLAGAPPDATARIVGCAFAPRCPNARETLCTAGRPPALAQVAARRVACLLHHEHRN